jgi:hypothetical protein
MGCFSYELFWLRAAGGEFTSLLVWLRVVLVTGCELCVMGYEL